MSEILLIDDDPNVVGELKQALDAELEGTTLSTRVWSPGREDRPDTMFERLLTAETVMVVTDYDLTRGGSTGFFGSAVVDWCKRKFLPVGDYSRGTALRQLPKEPDQYEIRVPSAPAEAAAFIKIVSTGFLSLTERIEDGWYELSLKRSPASILATVLNHPFEESRFAQYGTKIAAANASLMTQVSQMDSRNAAIAEMKRFLPYVLGHLLFNVILHFPGPIANTRALASFLAVSEDEMPALERHFLAAKYDGPFALLGPYFWIAEIESMLSTMRGEKEIEADTLGQLNRRTLELLEDRSLQRHECHRCQGEQGGLFCPFTKKTICSRSDCSIVSNAWIPQGARLCRIERDFYDEWAPLLGF